MLSLLPFKEPTRHAEDVRAFAAGELIQAERKMVDDCIRIIERRMPKLRRRVEPDNA